MDSKDKLLPLDLFQILDRVYPVGSFYSNKIDTRNPNLILGFGTWAAVSGVVLVGKTASSTFSTLGEVLGEAYHTLSINEMPSHTHSKTVIPKENPWLAPTTGWNYSYTNGASYVQETNATGGGAVHNNIQPTLVVMMWVRTS